MDIQLGKTYLTTHGRFVKIDNEPWAGVFNGEYEDDGRCQDSLNRDCGRWLLDGRAWNFIFPNHEYYTPEHDIIMIDNEEARIIAENMKTGRKQKAYNETL